MVLLDYIIANLMLYIMFIGGVYNENGGFTITFQSKRRVEIM